MTLCEQFTEKIKGRTYFCLTKQNKTYRAFALNISEINQFLTVQTGSVAKPVVLLQNWATFIFLPMVCCLLLVSSKVKALEGGFDPLVLSTNWAQVLLHRLGKPATRAAFFNGLYDLL